MSVRTEASHKETAAVEAPCRDFREGSAGILALNAAVEPTHTGNFGRGSAVVTEKVRTLPQRSANAAKEIKNLIGTSAERVKSGAKLVDESGKTMECIVMQIERVSDLIAQIRSATQEQSGGLNQIDQAVSNIHRIAQQNAFLVEQNAAASLSLDDQAAQLVYVVSVFR
jgi:aerotaxis receptor